MGMELTDEMTEELMAELGALKGQNHHLIGLCEYMRKRCESLEEGINKYHRVMQTLATEDGGVLDKLAEFLGGINVGEGSDDAVQPQERPGGEGTPPEKATGQTTH